MRLKIEKMAQGGRGLARLDDGRICFVEDALPGETVEAQVVRSKKDYAEACAVQILEAHALRVVPACPLYGRCGGCNLQHASAELQTQIHREVVEELFERMAKTHLPMDWVIHAGAPWAYRNRARFIKTPQGWGFRERASNRWVSLKNCPVLTEGLNDFLTQTPGRGRARELDVFDNGQGHVVWDSPTLVPLLGKQVSMDPSVFFQSNLQLLPELVQAVIHAAGEGQHVVDLFSGVGLFSLFLQDHFQQVSAVERDKGCLAHAHKHLASHVQFVAEPAEDWLMGPARMQGVDCVVVDPPRTGLPPSVCQALIQSQTQRLIYISCDPVTLARDTRLFLAGGYRLVQANGFSFYPQTSHFEMMAVFEPAR